MENSEEDNNLIILKAAVGEVPILVGLIIELLKDFNSKNNQSDHKFNVDRKKLEEVATELVARKNYAAYIAYRIKDNVPMGIITISQASAIYNAGDFGVITELYVDRNNRSKLIGSRLVHEACKFALEKGWKKVEVGAPSSKDWPRTIAFYERYGFVQKGPKLRFDLV